MTALPGEIEGAIAEGIEIVTLKAPASLNVGEDTRSMASTRPRR